VPWFAAWSGDDLRRGLLPFDDGRVADVAEQLKVAAGDCSGWSLGLLVGRRMFVTLKSIGCSAAHVFREFWIRWIVAVS
jgi:hypothetical protein